MYNANTNCRNCRLASHPCFLPLTAVMPDGSSSLASYHASIAPGDVRFNSVPPTNEVIVTQRHRRESGC